MNEFTLAKSHLSASFARRLFPNKQTSKHTWFPLIQLVQSTVVTSVPKVLHRNANWTSTFESTPVKSLSNVSTVKRGSTRNATLKRMFEFTQEKLSLNVKSVQKHLTEEENLRLMSKHIYSPPINRIEITKILNQ